MKILKALMALILSLGILSLVLGQSWAVESSQAAQDSGTKVHKTTAKKKTSKKKKGADKGGKIKVEDPHFTGMDDVSGQTEVSEQPGNASKPNHKK
jgi:hypothetical protein